MAESLMAKSEQFSYLNSSYGALSFTDFIDQYKTQYENCLPKARLFELTLPWLAATEEFMLPENSQVIVHCLYQTSEGQEPVLSIAWPLVHSTNNSFNKKTKSKSLKHGITSLTSFYSSVAEPIFFISPAKENLHQLFFYIEQEHQWHSMQLGSFEEGLVAQTLVEHFPYQQRPSQLRNTIKRREKKLTKAHQYRTEIITDINTFSTAFTAYKAI